MIEKDKYLAASPVKVDQKELISLSGIGKMIQLDPSLIRSLQAGSYVSQYKGRGMEFDESRPYHPGDDPRNIDSQGKYIKSKIKKIIYVYLTDPVGKMVDVMI